MAPSEAVKRWRKEAESRSASTSAQACFSLAGRYREGREGLPLNEKLAVKFYRRAAAQNHGCAMYNLGAMISNGEGVTRNDAQSVAWFRKAAEMTESSCACDHSRGHARARAQGSLGFCYKTGAGVEQDGALAVMWWEKGIEQGDHMCLLSLGTAYMHGTCGLAQSTVIAKIYMKGAAELGNTMAIERLKVLRACVACGRALHVHTFLSFT